ncbi:hypothetical protein BKI52_41595 [marine bacterium AO1-C]|nr:hypothetical protein BKI52_41595 [marine bacterium AO1-C]
MKDLSDANNSSKQPHPKPDFDQLMDKYQQVHQGLREDIQLNIQKTSIWKSVNVFTVALLGGAIAIVGIFWWQTTNENTVSAQKAQTALERNEVQQWVTVKAPKEKKTVKEESPEVITSQIPLVDTTTKNVAKREPTAMKDTLANMGKTKEENSNAKKAPALNVFTKAAPMVGMNALYIYLQQALQYPDEARKHKISGKVLTRFEIDTNGKIINVSVLEGLGYGCDQEAIRIVQNMPDWHPATINGKPTKTALKIPIVFNFKELKKKAAKKDTTKKK